MIAYSEFFNDARMKSYVNILNNSGHTVDLFILGKIFNSNKDNNTYCDRNNLFIIQEKYIGESTFLYVTSYIKYFIKTFIKISILYFKERYHVVHVNNMPNFIVFAGLIPKLFGKKIILDIHDLMVPIYLTKFTGKTKKLVFGYLLELEQKISALFADHIICADHLQRDSLRDDYKISNDKISVFMNLPNENLFKIVKVPPASDKFNLIYHGTISKRLGIDLLLNSVYILKKKINIKLFLYGAGEYLDEIIKQRNTLGMEEDVYIHGKFVPMEDLSPIICSMDAGIIGNRYSMATNKYMMPVKLLEYVYHDIPVIAPRLDIIKYYFNEEMVKYYDAENVEQMCECIVDFYNNPEERINKIKNARKIFDKYNSHGIAMEYINLVGSI